MGDVPKGRRDGQYGYQADLIQQGVNRVSRFKPGQSGNPKGRPKGSGLTGRLRKAIADEAQGIIDGLIAQAKNGDVAAARVLLDRILPALKPESAPVAIRGMEAGTLSEKAQAVLNGAARGDLAPDVAATLVGAMGTVARIVETYELEARIIALEEKHGEEN